MSNTATGGGPNSTPLLDTCLGQGTYATHLAGRLLEFFADTTPWARRLWDAGSVFALRELHEASQWAHLRVLSGTSLTWFARDLERLIGPDRAIGSKERRRELRDALISDLVHRGRHHRALKELTDAVEDGYLLRWADAVGSPKPPSPERLSRAVAAHLLDRGYDAGFLHRWTRHHFSDSASIAEFLVQANDMAAAPHQRYDVLVPFQSVPQQDQLATGLAQWRDAPAVSDWLAKHAGGPAGIRQGGGFLYSVQAMDPYAAAAEAARTVERLLARATFARRNSPHLVPTSRIWVGDCDVTLPLRQPDRGAYLLSLVSERQLYDVSARTRLDAALELAAPLNHGAAGPAVSGGWAAVEALLVTAEDPEDTREGKGAVACGRVADLVACSWPRAELTTLAHRHRPEAADHLAAEISACSTNRERAAAVLRAIQDGRSLALSKPGDRAAEARIRKLLSAPHDELRDVRHHVEVAMRRFYRHRNILLHGGGTEAMALQVALRTAAPLIGACLDRIAHAHLTAGIQPLDLAERARLSVALVAADDGPPLTDLLE